MPATFWLASSVTVNNTLNYITVQTGDDISSIYENSFLKVSNYSEPVEVKRAYMNAAVPTIELFSNWPGANASGVSAVVVPSAAAVAAAAVDVQALVTLYTALGDSVSSVATADSLVKRTSAGRIKAVASSASDDVVVKSEIGTAATKDVTTSATDATADRLLKVGDFGIGIGRATTDTDMNAGDYVKAGNIVTSNAVNLLTNRPPMDTATSTRYTVEFIGSPTGTGAQRATNRSTGSTYVRGTLDGVWSDWNELYHSGNTNFDTWKSVSIGDILCTGIAVSSTTLRFFIDTDFLLNPAGITVLSGKTFSINAANDAAFAAGITTLGFNGRSTPKQLVFDVTTSGLTTGNTYQLRSEQADSQFKATF